MGGLASPVTHAGSPQCHHASTAHNHPYTQLTSATAQETREAIAQHTNIKQSL